MQFETITVTFKEWFSVGIAIACFSFAKSGSRVKPERNKYNKKGVKYEQSSFCSD
jgi:hypothetical protein